MNLDYAILYGHIPLNVRATHRWDHVLKHTLIDKTNKNLQLPSARSCGITAPKDISTHSYTFRGFNFNTVTELRWYLSSTSVIFSNKASLISFHSSHSFSINFCFTSDTMGERVNLFVFCVYVFCSCTLPPVNVASAAAFHYHNIHTYAYNICWFYTDSRLRLCVKLAYRINKLMKSVYISEYTSNSPRSICSCFHHHMRLSYR